MSSDPTGRKSVKQKPVSLRFVLVLGIVGLQAISVLLVVLINYVSMGNAISKQSKDLISEQNTAIASDVSNFFSPLSKVNEMLVRIIESETVLLEDDSSIERLLFRTLRTSQDMAGIYFVRPDGTHIYVYKSENPSTTITKRIGSLGEVATVLYRDDGFTPLHRFKAFSKEEDPRGFSWYGLAMENQDSSLSDSHVFSTSENPELIISQAAYRNGDFVGVFGIFVEIGKLGRILSSQSQSSLQTTAILAENGQVVVHSKGVNQIRFVPIDTLTAYGDFITTQIYESFMTEGAASVREFNQSGAGLNGQKSLASIMPVDVNGLQWLVSMHAPQSDFTGGLSANHMRQTWIALSLLTVFSFCAIPLANRIRRPVIQFSEQTRDLSEAGTVSTVTPIAAPYLELESTGKAFASEMSKRRSFELLYEKSLSISSRGLARLNPTDLSFLYVNRRLCDILHMKEGDLLERTIYHLLPEEDGKALEKLQDGLIDHGDYKVACDYLSANGEIVSLRTVFSLVRDHLGEPHHVVASFEYSKESGTTATHLENLKKDIEHVGTIELMGQFAAGLAHELNQPLGALVHDLDTAQLVLQDDPMDREELSEILNDIDQHAHRAGEVIRVLRDLIQKDGMTSYLFDLSDLIGQIDEIVRPEAGAYDINVEYDIDDRCSVVGNPMQIAQALMHLIRNAIGVLASCGTQTKRITVSAAVEGSDSVMRIEDNGPGFPMDNRPFENFGGAAFGLSICKSLLDANKCKIVHEVPDGGGARFLITLPGNDLDQADE